MTPDRSERRCSNCGAAVARRAARFCEFCGTELPAEAVATPPSPFGDVASRFAELERSAGLAALMQRDPARETEAGRGLLGETGCAVAFTLLVCSVVAFVAFSSMAFFPPAAFVALAIGGVALYGLITSIARSHVLTTGPLERLTALVVDERTKISGHRDGHARTEYFTTLQLADGERIEVPALERVVGRTTRGDMGVAYLRAGTLVDFQRVPV